MDAAKTRLQIGGQHAGQGVDGQARSVGGQNCVRRDKGCNFLVEVFFPVQAFGYGFDDEVAALELV